MSTRAVRLAWILAGMPVVSCPKCHQDTQWAPDEAALVGKECHACFEQEVEAEMRKEEVGAPMPEVIPVSSLMAPAENVNAEYVPVGVADFIRRALDGK